LRHHFEIAPEVVDLTTLLPYPISRTFPGGGVYVNSRLIGGCHCPPDHRVQYFRQGDCLRPAWAITGEHALHVMAMQKKRFGPDSYLRMIRTRPMPGHCRAADLVIHRRGRQIRAVFHRVGIGQPQCVSKMQQAKIFAICRIDCHSSVPRMVTSSVAAQCGSG
jgi:hypothetical protein